MPYTQSIKKETQEIGILKMTSHLTVNGVDRLVMNLKKSHMTEINYLIDEIQKLKTNIKLLEASLNKDYDC